MSGKTVSEFSKQYLQPGKKDKIIDHAECRSSRIVRSAIANSSPCVKPAPSPASSSPPPNPAAITALNVNQLADNNQLANVHSDITFLQQQHSVVLNGLHEQVEELQKKCKELQFCLTMQLPYFSDEERTRITILEKALYDKGLECGELRDELLKCEHKILKLRKELHLKDQAERQLRRQWETREKKGHDDRVKSSNISVTPVKEISMQLVKGKLRDPGSVNGHGHIFSSSTSNQQYQQQNQHPIPTPPPRDSRLKVSARPAALYRRLLGLGPRSCGSPTSQTPPVVESNGSRNSSSSSSSSSGEKSLTSSIPQLPRLVGSPSTLLRQPRPLVRQQLRVSRVAGNSVAREMNQTLSIDQNPLTGSPMKRTDQNQHNRSNY